ncbi:uncharacterized protein LOC123642907 isoform X2 [Lemur catta]|uniref:uncharacterized protein LOC123642907 isoform X2 n=1 Tax=Lemur catta TaxID=9447 RepID=UPI001E26E2AA|nr:uncharacterized protein LOC123642907 isoform X2 [Lemur catta]
MFNETCCFHVQLLDFKRFSGHQPLGALSLPLGAVDLQHVLERWYQLGPPGTTEVQLMLEQRKWKKRRTSARKGSASPYFNEAFTFLLPVSQVQSPQAEPWALSMLPWGTRCNKRLLLPCVSRSSPVGTWWQGRGSVLRMTAPVQTQVTRCLTGAGPWVEGDPAGVLTPPAPTGEAGGGLQQGTVWGRDPSSFGCHCGASPVWTAGGTAHLRKRLRALGGAALAGCASPSPHIWAPAPRVSSDLPHGLGAGRAGAKSPGRRRQVTARCLSRVGTRGGGPALAARRPSPSGSERGSRAGGAAVPGCEDVCPSCPGEGSRGRPAPPPILLPGVGEDRFTLCRPGRPCLGGLGLTREGLADRRTVDSRAQQGEPAAVPRDSEAR